MGGTVPGGLGKLRGMRAEQNRAFLAARRRPWFWLLVGLFALSAALLFYLRSRIGFFLDDWYLVLLRDGPGDWFLPHNQHIIILPAAIYELSLSLFGMDAMPLHLVALALFLISVALLFQWLRPLVGEPVSVLGCAVVLFLGAATGDLVFAFQIGFFGSVVGGLGALLLLRRDTFRTDLLACLLLIFSTLCSTLMAPFLAAAAVELLYRGDGRASVARLLRGSWVVLVPLLIYVIWWVGWNQHGSQEITIENVLKLPLYVFAAFGFAGASLTGAFPLRDVVDNYLWVIPGVAMAAGFIWILRRRGNVPPAFLVGLVAALGFWGLCGLNYSPARDFFTSRYQYPSVIFLLMMLAGACQGMRPDARTIKWLCGLAVISVAINTAGLFYALNNVYRPYEEQNLVNLATIDLAWDTVDPGFRVGIGTEGGGQVSAEAYRAAVDRYGRPDLTEDDLTGASDENQRKLDQLLVLALPVRILPASEIRPQRSGCRDLAADPAASNTTTLNSPLVYVHAQRDVVIRLGRYAPGATAVAWRAKAGQATGYKIPLDRSNRHWRIGFQGAGEVTVCPAVSNVG